MAIESALPRPSASRPPKRSTRSRAPDRVLDHQQRFIPFGRSSPNRSTLPWTSGCGPREAFPGSDRPSRVSHRIHQHFDDLVGAALVDEVIEKEFRRFDRARVVTFVPVLVERAARRRLAAIADGPAQRSAERATSASARFAAPRVSLLGARCHYRAQTRLAAAIPRRPIPEAHRTAPRAPREPAPRPARGRIRSSGRPTSHPWVVRQNGHDRRDPCARPQAGVSPA